MPNSRNYPDTIQNAESGRPLRRGVKMLTINRNGEPFTYAQPGWWASIDDPADDEGQLIDEDNVIRAAARTGGVSGSHRKGDDNGDRYVPGPEQRGGGGCGVAPMRRTTTDVTSQPMKARRPHF